MSYKSTEPAAGRRNAVDAWQETRQQTALATQFVGNRDDYLAGARPDVGRPSGPDERELFVSCAPDLALQQQFEHLEPEFIAVHDLSTTASRKLLVGLAAASQRNVQRLVIRRQGFGNVLAAIEYVELPTADGGALRLYSTAADADTAARQGLARVLLAFGRLGVMMIGDLPAHTIAALLQPFREAMLAGPWPNREMLLLPLSSNGALATQGAELGRGTGVRMRATPQVSRPADAWGYINGTWTQLRQAMSGSDRGLPQLAGAPAGDPAAEQRAARGDLGGRVERRARDRTPAPGRTAPAAPSAPAVPEAAAAPRRAASDDAAAFDRYLQQVAELPGLLSACLFDVRGDKAVAACGALPAPDELAQQGRTLLAAIGAAGQALGMDTGTLDLALTFGGHHLVLRSIATRRGYTLHAAFDKEDANLALARLQLQRLDALLKPASP